MIDDHASPQVAEAAPFGSGRWKVDPEGSEADFAAKTFWGLLTVRGHFDDLDGWLEVGTAAPDQAQGELTIKAAGIDTGNAKRDKHLRSADFFDVEDNPSVTFKVARVDDLGDGRVTIAGDLEAAGKATPLELEAKVSSDRGRITIEGGTTVDQSLFGMKWSPLGMVKKEARLHVKVALDPA